VDRFTAADVQSGLVRYDHEDPDVETGNSYDRFTFVVCITTLCAEGHVDIWVSPERPSTTALPVLPAVVSRTVVVDRTLGFVVLTADDLNASCVRCLLPFNVTYSTTSSPQHGRLVLRSGRNENESLASFSQRDVDLGHVIYRHVDAAHLSDSVQLSVSVGSRDDDVIWSSDVRLEIRIKPNVTEIVLSVAGNVSVTEGERAFITENQLRIQHGGDVDDVEIVVVRLPVYGRIQVIDGQLVRVRMSFLLSEVN